jgi:hypothetical protein
MLQSHREHVFYSVRVRTRLRTHVNIEHLTRSLYKE